MKILHDLFIGDYPISQTFGVNYDAYKWILDYRGLPIKGHNGIDWATPVGTILLNPFPKTSTVVVTKVGWDQYGYGNYLRLWDKTQQCVILYAHCSEILVNEGDTLYFQQAVAKTGNTGNSTGPHVHVGYYEVDEQGYKLNRDNGFDGFLHPLSGVIDWKVLNPSKPGEPPVVADPLKVCLSQHEELVTLLDQRGQDLDDYKRKYETLQSETASRLAAKDKECQAKIEAFRQKILDVIKSLAV